MTLATAAAAGTDRPTPQLAEFRSRLEELAGRPLADAGTLHAFSVEHAADFWRELLRWSRLPWSGSDEVVLTDGDVETARFFPGVRLNYAEALLQPLPGVDDESPALTSVHADRPDERWSRAELRAEVRRTAARLAGIGLRTGERVALVAPNTGRTAIVALAAAALGAPVATAPPDMGAAALLGRFEQVEPVLLVVDRTGMAEETLDRLLAGLPTLRRVVLLDDQPLPTVTLPVDPLAALPGTESDCPGWERRAFDAPLFVLFSSGTSGPPKAMVHGVGGTLLEHVKEHRLHNDLRPDDVYYHHSTTAWMVWNRHLSALATGAHVVVYDGPVAGPETLWELVADQGVTVFGTSPAFLQLCEDAGYRPADAVDLSRLRTVLSSGAVLQDWQYDWVADAVGPLPCSRSAAEPTSSARSCSPTRRCRCGAGASRPAASAWTWRRSTTTAARWSDGSANWCAAIRSRPVRSPSSATRTVGGSTRPTSCRTRGCGPTATSSTSSRTGRRGCTAARTAS